MQEAGGRRQEAGGRRQEAGGTWWFKTTKVVLRPVYHCKFMY
jgi:hypothetical protein